MENYRQQIESAKSKVSAAKEKHAKTVRRLKDARASLRDARSDRDYLIEKRNREFMDILRDMTSESKTLTAQEIANLTDGNFSKQSVAGYAAKAASYQLGQFLAEQYAKGEINYNVSKTYCKRATFPELQRDVVMKTKRTVELDDDNNIIPGTESHETILTHVYYVK